MYAIRTHYWRKDTRVDETSLTGAGPALFHIVRFWSRRWALRAAGDTTAYHVMVLEAVDSTAGPEVSVADVAHHLGIDHSGASRFVGAAIEDGYLARRASTADRRRVALTITPSGRDLLANAHAWQEQAFARLTADWDPAEAAQFAGHLRRLAGELN
jgi:DNA-binding MarR family transcriptional regulator